MHTEVEKNQFWPNYPSFLSFYQSLSPWTQLKHDLFKEAFPGHPHLQLIWYLSFVLFDSPIRPDAHTHVFQLLSVFSESTLAYYIKNPDRAHYILTKGWLYSEYSNLVSWQTAKSCIAENTFFRAHILPQMQILCVEVPLVLNFLMCKFKYNIFLLSCILGCLFMCEMKGLDKIPKIFFSVILSYNSRFAF